MSTFSQHSNSTNGFTEHALPCKMGYPQAITIPYKNFLSSFIFGAFWINKIYRYNHSTAKYELYDKYNATSGWSNPDAFATVLGGVFAYVGIYVWSVIPYTYLIW